MEEFKGSCRSHTPTAEELRGRSGVRRVTVVGLIGNLVLAAVKFAAGVLGNSQAVVADAVHTLTDMTTDVAILVGVGYWSAPADECHPHGHARIETAVTVGIGVVLAVAAFLLGYEGLSSLHERRLPHPSPAAFWAAVLSIAAKEALFRWTFAVGKRLKSTALIANAWHHRTDALSSIPVALAVGATLISPMWSFLDPLGAVFVSLFILRAAWGIIRPALGELVDVGAPQEVRNRVIEIARQTPGVLDVHGVRTRYAGSRLQVDLHVLVHDTLTVREGHEISEEVKRRLLAFGPDVIDVVVHLEPYEDESSEKSSSQESSSQENF